MDLQKREQLESSGWVVGTTEDFLNMNMSLEQIKELRSKLDLELKKLQQSCTHPKIVVTDGGNTGNGHVADNVYWTKKWCPDCEWRELIYID